MTKTDPFLSPVVSFGRARTVDAAFPAKPTEHGFVLAAESVADIDEWLTRVAAGIGLLHAEALAAGFSSEGHAVHVFVDATGETSVAINAQRQVSLGELAFDTALDIEPTDDELRAIEGEEEVAAKVTPISAHPGFSPEEGWAGDDGTPPGPPDTPHPANDRPVG